MNAMYLVELPLVLGFVGLLGLAAWKKNDIPIISTGLACLACLWASVAIAGLPLDASFFGGAIKATAIGKGLAIACCLLAALALFMVDGYLSKVRIHGLDWKMTVMASLLGMVHLVLAQDLATFFVSFELVSIPSYLLAGFSVRDPRSNQAGMKYLLLGMVGSVFFLLGISFLYGASGSIFLTDISEAIYRGGSGQQSLALMSLVFFLIAFLFKTGAAPLHFWLPEVYQGSSYAALAVIASPAKLAVFGALYMLIQGPFSALDSYWKPALLLFALASVIFGNLQALTQTNLKRLFAFSSVLNAGFILLAIRSGAPGTSLYYLCAYGLMSSGIWAAFIALGTQVSDVDEFDDIQGVGKKHPALAIAITVILLSFAGIPLTMGFTAKFHVASDLLRGGEGLEALVLLLVTVLSFFYYLRLVYLIWFSNESHSNLKRALPANATVVVYGVACLLVLGSIFFRFPGLS